MNKYLPAFSPSLPLGYLCHHSTFARGVSVMIVPFCGLLGVDLLWAGGRGVIVSCSSYFSLNVGGFFEPLVPK